MICLLTGALPRTVSGQTLISRHPVVRIEYIYKVGEITATCCLRATKSGGVSNELADLQEAPLDEG